MDHQNPSVPQQPLPKSVDGDQRLTKRQRRELRRQEKAMASARGDQRKRWSTMGWWLGGLVAAGLITWAILAAGGGGSTANVNLAEDTTDPVRGNVDATVVFREYSDFQCPACRAAEPFVKSLVDEFGDRVRFEYNDFPLITIHPNALLAANAGQCAAAQGKFWELHDTLFDRQSDWASLGRDAARTVFTQYADTLGLDRAAFSTCLQDEQYRERVQQDINEAGQLKINSTPTFVVNDRVLSGVSTDAVRGAITDALAAAATTPATNAAGE